MGKGGQVARTIRSVLVDSPDSLGAKSGARLARKVRELAPYHWVRTPYRCCPVEPRWIFPFLQFLSKSITAVLAPRPGDR